MSIALPSMITRGRHVVGRRVLPGGDRGDQRAPDPVAAAPVAVDIVIPVYNEAGGLERSVRRLDTFLAGFPFPTRITVVDNASVDGTWAVARRLRNELPRVEVIHLDEKGRGRALRSAWMRSDAPVVAYMDVDLSTDLSALLPLVAPLLSGHSDVAIGSRLSPGSHVTRGLKREVISRGYNLVLRAGLRTGFRDAQCGFKAMRTDVARRLLPLVEDQSWFFDTELLVLAERGGMRIHEVPVDWTDDPDSRVEIVPTAIEDLRGVWRVRRALSRGEALGSLDDLRRRPRRPPSGSRQAASFGVIGVACTIAYLLVFWVLRDLMAATLANAGALLITAVANTAANRRYTFGIRGRDGRLRHHASGLGAFGLALLMTTGAIWALAHLDPSAGRLTELGTLVAANLLSTVVRFVALRASIVGVRPQAGGRWWPESRRLRYRSRSTVSSAEDGGGNNAPIHGLPR